MKNSPLLFLVFLLALISAAGCSPALLRMEQSKTPPATATVRAAETSRTTPTVEKKVTRVSGVSLGETRPGEPVGTPQTIHDQTCAETAASKRAPGGDDYSDGRFERPFDRDMNYAPSLDIVRGDLFRPDDGWLYFIITLVSGPTAGSTVYGIELDTNIDGRGDYLIQVTAPVSETWSESGVKMWWDSDGDVGGQAINRSDPRGFKGSGFEASKINPETGKNIGQLWSRSSEYGIQIALNGKWVGGKEGKFTWKPYSDGNSYSTTFYDLDDYFLLEQAGSPLIGERDYPLKAVFAYDNTCRGLSGLTPSGSEQGVCPR